MHSLQYYVEEAITSLGRGRLASALAVFTIAVALFVFGAFLLVTGAFDRLMSQWDAAAEMSVYLRDDVTPPQKSAVEAACTRSGFVDRVVFVSKEDAARRFREDFPDFAGVAASLDANPFPASFDVRVRQTSSRALDDLARSLATLPGVSDVRFDRRWLERLRAIVAVVRWVGIALASALALAAGLTMAAVVRLAMHGRRDEVEIMLLAGAPLAAVRGPFIAEGVLLGALGGLVGLVALRLAYAAAYGFVAPVLAPLDSAILGFLSLPVSAAIVGGGMLVGCLGGVVAARD